MATFDMSEIDDLKIKTLYDTFDRNKDGKITFKEIKDTCQILGHEITEEEIKSFFLSHDAD